MKKKILLSAAGFLAAMFLTAGFREVVWYRFEMRPVVGETITGSTDDLEGMSRRWFSEYYDQFKGWSVPYDYRITDAAIDRIEVLTDLETPYVEIDYTVHVASANDRIVQNLELTGTDSRRVYTGQMVIRWEKSGDSTYTIAEKLRPVQYQIRTPEFQEERNTPQTEHFQMRTDEQMTYYIENEVLYVTYDGGENFVEVPDGYEKVCTMANGSYNELLPYNSYLVTEEFTAFVTHNSLLYSTDKGETWKESQIYAGAYRANVYVSMTDNGCYVTLAVDRSLGSDYYQTFCSQDLETWTAVQSPETGWSNLTCSFWTKDGRGYYAKGDSLSMTADNGATFREIETPEAVEVTSELGFNPFDTVGKMYEKDGVLYAVVGQGDDGDYVKDGKLAEALYQSQDGVTFTFVEEIADDTPEQAG